jgi:hypothetical protein
MNSLGWSRRDTDIPVNTSQQSGLLSSIKSLNPFGDSGYVRLPTTEGSGAPLPAPSRREEEEGWFVCESIISLSVSEYAASLLSGLSWQSSTAFPVLSPASRLPLQDMCRTYICLRCSAHEHPARPAWVICRPSHPGYAGHHASCPSIQSKAD